MGRFCPLRYILPRTCEGTDVMAECTGCSGSNGPDQSSLGGAGDNDGPSASDVASNLAEASTGPAGLEPDRYAAHVDAAMDAARAGYLGDVNPADIETAAMAQMNPREQGQFQQAMDSYRTDLFTSASQQVAMTAPFDQPYTSPFNAVAVNAQGQPINSCGHVVPEQTYVSAPDPFAQYQAEQREIALENIDRIRGGAISGLATSIAVGLGADQRTIEQVHSVGVILDGLTAPLGPGPEGAMRP